MIKLGMNPGINWRLAPHLGRDAVMLLNSELDAFENHLKLEATRR